MWHGVYLAWLEEARVEALAAVGLAYSDLSARGLELPVVSLAIDYRRSLLHGDQVELRSRVLPLSGVKLPWESRFLASSGELAASARVDLVLVERRGDVGAEAGPRLRRRWPDELAQAVEALRRGPR
jgi:acyl-CoA thioester hydrolase